MGHNNFSDTNNNGLAGDLEHPQFTDWQYEVTNGDTSRGFHDWLTANNDDESDLTKHFAVSTRPISTLRVSEPQPCSRECVTTGLRSGLAIEGSYTFDHHPEYDPSAQAYNKAEFYDYLIKGLAREVIGLTACFSPAPVFEDIVTEYIDLHKLAPAQARDKARRIQRLLLWFSGLTADERAELETAAVDLSGEKDDFCAIAETSVDIRSHNAKIRELSEVRASLQSRRAALTPWLAWK